VLGPLEITARKASDIACDSGVSLGVQRLDLFGQRRVRLRPPGSHAPGEKRQTESEGARTATLAGL
jgi:hypothetical protein